MPRFIRDGIIMDVDRLHENLFINKGWKPYVEVVIEQIETAVNDENSKENGQTDNPLDSNNADNNSETSTEGVPTKRDISRMNKGTLIEFAKTHELNLTATTRDAIIEEILKQLNLN